MHRREFLGAAASAALLFAARPALAEPLTVKLISQHDGLFKGHRRVVIPAYHVNYITSQQATAVATIGARSRLAMALFGVDEATMRRLADEAYADLVAQFGAAGVEVVSEADARALVSTAGMERAPGNLIQGGGGGGVTVGKSLRRGFVTVGASQAPALTAYKLPEQTGGFGNSMAIAGQLGAGKGMQKPAWDLDANVLIPSLTLDFAQMEASTGQGMFGATSSASGAVQFMIRADSPLTTLNPASGGRFSTPGGLRPDRDVVSRTPFATVEEGGAPVRVGSMTTTVDENYQTVARARGDAVIVNLPVWKGLVRDAFRAYNAAIVGAVARVVKK